MGENSLQPIHGGFETLLKFLNENGKIKVLIANYDAPAYARREKFESAEISKRIRADWIASVGNLIQLNQLKKSGKLEVRYTPQKQYGSLVIIDNWHLQFNRYNTTPLEKGKRGWHSGVDLYSKEHDTFKEKLQLFNNSWKNSRKRILHLEDIDMTSMVPRKFFSQVN
jgi:hypothetical protein